MQVNLSPSLNTDTPVDIDIKTRLLRDLLTLVGLPAVDPVLGRAEAEQQAAGRRGRRVRSAGGSQRTRGPGPPALSTLVREAREQQERAGGWGRGFPTLDSCAAHGSLADWSGGSTNRALHQQVGRY